MTLSTSIDADALLGRVEELFVAHVEGVYNVAHRVLWNRADAEDVVQRTFLKAVTHLSDLRESAKARAWLLQVAYREAIATLRARRELPTDPADLPVGAAVVEDPADRVVADALAARVRAALAEMPEMERMAVVLRDAEGLPMAEVAAVLDVGLSAAKMRVHRGRERLRVLLATEVM